MTAYLPDTNILVDAFNGKRGRRELLDRLISEGNRLGRCDVTVAEIYSGMRPHESARTDEFMSALAWYHSSRKIAGIAGQLRFEYGRKGIPLSLADALIAATALEYDLILLTANTRHFPMPALRLYALAER